MKSNIIGKYISSIPFISFITLISFLSACEKDITIELPDVEQKIVIQGHIEPGLPPYVILTKSTSFFEPVGLSNFDSLFVRDAVVKVSDGINEVTLTEFCVNDIDTSLLPIISEFIGIPPENLLNLKYCVYTTFDFSIFGKAGTTYNLTVTAQGKTYTSKTDIPVLVPLDSIWFNVQPPHDSLGFIWAHLTEPAASGNAYRWFAKRLGKDNSFIAPFGSMFDDKFINGKSFDFGYDRGHHPNEEDNDESSHFYKIGDTIVVKFCTIDRGHYDFWRSFDTEIVSAGNPFAAPTSIITNIEGGALGVWGGYGVSYDTTIAK